MARFPGLETSAYRGQTRVVVGEPVSLEVLSFLAAAGFDLLVDVTCVDYLEYRGAQRHGLVYLLAATATADRLTVRVFVDDPNPAVRSVVGLWRLGRLAGARGVGHVRNRFRRAPRPPPPDDARAVHRPPAAQDYPLQGRGERHNFPVLTREDG